MMPGGDNRSGYGGAFRETSLEKLSRVLGYKVESVGDIALVPEDRRGRPAREDFEKYGIVSRFATDGTLVVYAGVRDGAINYGRALSCALYQVCAVYGLDGILASTAAMRRVVSGCGVISTGLSDTDVRAMLMSCAYDGYAGKCQKVASKILSVAYGGAEQSHSSVTAVINGLYEYRKRRIRALDGEGNEVERDEFARECLSRWSDHIHMHLGFPSGAFSVMGYPKEDMYCRLDDVRNLAREMGISTNELLDMGLLKEMANPLLVLSLRHTGKESYCMAVLNIRKANGDFVTMSMPLPETIKNSGNGFSVKGFRGHGFGTICRQISWVDNMSGKHTNVLYARPVKGLRPQLGRSCETEFGALLEDMKKTQWRPGQGDAPQVLSATTGDIDREERKKFQSHPDVDIYHTAKIIKYFKYTKLQAEDRPEIKNRSGKNRREKKRRLDPTILDAAKVSASDGFVKALSAFPRNASMQDLVLPVLHDGSPVKGADAFVLMAGMLSSPQWDNCGVFVSAEWLGASGLSLKEGAEAISGLSEGAGAVYNLMDAELSQAAREAVLLKVIDEGITVPPSFTYFLSSVDGEKLKSPETLRARMDEIYASGVPDVFPAKGLDVLLDEAVSQMREEYDPKGVFVKAGVPDDVVRQVLLTGEARYQGPVSGGSGTVDADVTFRMEGREIHVYRPQMEDLGSLRQVFLVAKPDLEPLRRTEVNKGGGKGKAYHINSELLKDNDGISKGK